MLRHMALTKSTEVSRPCKGLGRSTKPVAWTRGTERAMVVDGYTWSRVPGTDVEVRALTDRPLALRYGPRPTILRKLALRSRAVVEDGAGRC